MEVDSEVYLCTGISVERASGRIDGIAVPLDCVIMSLFHNDKILGPRVHEYILDWEQVVMLSAAFVNAAKKHMKEDKKP